MQSIRILMLTSTMIIPFQAADAQLLFGSRLGEAHYQGDDTKIIMCTATNRLDTGEGLRCGWSGLWASDLREGCHRARPGQAQAAVAGACGPA